MPPPPNPYIIWGLALSNAVVTIHNETKDTTDTVTANSAGQYIYDDIQESPLLAELGDTIIVTAVGGASESFEVVAPEEKEINVNYVAISMDGGSVCGGIAGVAFSSGAVTETYSMVGGAVVGSSAVREITFPGMIGGAVAGGACLFETTDVEIYTVDMAGGAVAGGTPIYSFITAGGTTTKTVAMIGGCVAGGSGDLATVLMQISTIDMTGGAVAGCDSATVFNIIKDETMSGGAVVGGTIFGGYELFPTLTHLKSYATTLTNTTTYTITATNAGGN